MSSYDTNRPLAFLVDIVDLYGSRRLRATVVRVQPDGKLNNLNDMFGREALEEFAASAYIESDKRDGSNVYGLSHGYEDVFRVSTVERAKDMVKVLTTVHRGLERFNDRMGNLREGDFAPYVFRIASILKIGSVYVTNNARQEDMTGERQRQVNASELQTRVAMMVDAAQSGRINEYTRGRR